MTYDSPKTLRRRQQAAEKPRQAKQPQTIRVQTDQEWGAACEAMLFRVNAQMWQRHAEAAGRCGQALVHMAIQRRACQLMREFELLSVLKAMAIARVELLGKEPL